MFVKECGLSVLVTCYSLEETNIILLCHLSNVDWNPFGGSTRVCEPAIGDPFSL